jgi:prolyl 4-hydroxylase
MQFIREYELPDTGVCDALIRCFQECEALDCVHRGRLGHQKVRVEQKDSYDLSLSNIPPAVAETYKETFDAYFAALGAFASDYMDRFPHLRSHTRSCSINEPPNIQHYPPKGGFFEEHYENAGPAVAKRVLTFQSFLNDIQDGGGTRFVYQDYVANPAKGKTVLWPAGYTHVHCGVVAPREDKYIITGWWSYDEPAKT